MTTPFYIGQPALAMPYAIITNANFPSTFGGPQVSGTAYIDGMIITTAFDVQRITNYQSTPQVALAAGQVESVVSNEALAATLGGTYGGDGSSTFTLPNLTGAAPIFPTGAGAWPMWGQYLGNASNSVVLTQNQLPEEVGGTSQPIANAQYGLGMEYLIQVTGLYPSGNGPTLSTMGMVYPYAAPLHGQIPDGFMRCDGSLLQISDYTVLYSLLGTTYGGDGVQTFALPDLRNRIPIGTGLAPDGQNIAAGQVIGSSEILLNGEQLPTGMRLPVGTMQPSLGMHYVINTEGIYLGMDEYDPLLGQVTLYAGQILPESWVRAEGQVVSIDSNAALYSLLSNTFGGDGYQTFALPNLAGRTVIGTGGEENYYIGQQIGRSEAYLLSDNIPDVVVPVPGLHLTNDSGQTVGDEITGAFNLDVSGTWSGATLQFSSDGTTWSTSYQAQEGANTVMVRQVDVLGQASVASSPITFTLDTTAPVTPQIVLQGVTVAAVPESSVVTTQLLSAPSTSSGELSFLGVESGAVLQYSIDGGLTWTDSFEAVSGLNSVQVRQVDVAGNVSAASEVVSFNWTGSADDAAQTSAVTNDLGGLDITVETYGTLSSNLGSDQVDELIYGLQHDLVLPDAIEYVRLTVNGLGNSAQGNAADNLFEIEQGNWVIDGKGGQDTVRFSGAIEDYLITQETVGGELQASIYGTEGKVVLTHVEAVEFSNASLQGIDGQGLTEVDYLYQAVLGRMPDWSGLTYWAQQVNAGLNLHQVAQAFVDSDEFAQRYGQSLTTDQFIEEMYESILGRAPDAAGQAYWSNAMASGTVTEAGLVVGLMLSAESQAISGHNPAADTLFVLG